MFDILQIWHMWIIAGVLLFVWEIFTPGFVVACFGVGAFASGFAAFTGMGPKMQLGVFAVISACTAFFIRPLVLKMLTNGSDKAQSNVEALVGRVCMVATAIDPEKEEGYVKVAGDQWRAVSITGETIPEGRKVIIEKVEGTRVFVRPYLAE
jgi:membrane protein implicated in regulation of membrane protease activity